MTAKLLGGSFQSRPKKRVVIRARCEAEQKQEVQDFLTNHSEFRSEGDFMRHAVGFYIQLKRYLQLHPEFSDEWALLRSMRDEPAKNFCPQQVGIHPSHAQDFTGAPRLQ